VPKVQPHPLSYRELLQRLERFGVGEAPKGGKGSERILTQSSGKGPHHTIKHHGDKTEIYVPVIRSILRRFGITPEDFWKDE